MPDLSVCIPARNEEWLARTVADVLEHSTADTEVIVVLDEVWPEPGLPQHPKVQVIKTPTAIGQRAATNLAARISTAPWLVKLDAHCSVAPGWDTTLIESAKELGKNTVQIPAQKNLHIYTWVCKNCGREEYQCGLDCCRVCYSKDLDRRIEWKPRGGTTTTRWRFDSTLHFQYWGGAPKGQAYVETMSCLGACWFISREQWDAFGGLDEGHGSWGNVGVELGCKAWLSGGRMVTNTKTWFSHFFRVGGQKFPYPITGAEQEYAKQYSRDLWLNNRWKGQTRPLSWLIDKFASIPGWHDASGAEVLNRVTREGLIFESSRTVTRGAETGDSPATSGSEVLLAVQRMPLGAVSLEAVDNADGRGNGDVLFVGDKLKVGGVTAMSDLALVVDDHSVGSGASTRNGGNEPCIHQAVCQDLDSVSTADKRVAVSCTDERALPQPAPSVGVDDDFGEDSAERSTVEMRDGEILPVSHLSASPAGGWLGASPRSQRDGAPLILSLQEQIDALSRGLRRLRSGESLGLLDGRSPGHDALDVQRSGHPGGLRGSVAGAGDSIHDPDVRSGVRPASAVRGSLSRTAVPVARPPSKGIVYYSDCRLRSDIASVALDTIRASGLPIVAVTIPRDDGRKVLIEGARNVHLDLQRGYLTMFRQILAGLELLETDVVFLCEHDVLYHPSHFDFAPPTEDRVYYNRNVWKVDAATGKALHYLCSQTSGLCANRELLVEHYRRRVALVEARGFSRKMGFEPGTHRRAERVDDLVAAVWMAEYPNVDIRHDRNLTQSRWSQDQFRDQRNCEGWTEGTGVPGWGETFGRFDDFLREAGRAAQPAVA